MADRCHRHSLAPSCERAARGDEDGAARQSVAVSGRWGRERGEQPQEAAAVRRLFRFAFCLWRSECIAVALANN